MRCFDKLLMKVHRSQLLTFTTIDEHTRVNGIDGRCLFIHAVFLPDRDARSTSIGCAY